MAVPGKPLAFPQVLNHKFCISTSADWNCGWDIAVALNAMGKAGAIAECAALVMEQFRCVTIACI